MQTNKLKVEFLHFFLCLEIQSRLYLFVLQTLDMLQSMGSLSRARLERLHFHFSFSCIGEGNGNPLQCSCLENPRDRGAWWAAVYGVAQSWTRLKRLSSSSSSRGCWLWACPACGKMLQLVVPLLALL